MQWYVHYQYNWFVPSVDETDEENIYRLNRRHKYRADFDSIVQILSQLLKI